MRFVCIDQTNSAERAQQVGMMREIYTEADKVLIWLRKKEEKTIVALKLIIQARYLFQDDPILGDEGEMWPSSVTKGYEKFYAAAGRISIQRITPQLNQGRGFPPGTRKTGPL